MEVIRQLVLALGVFAVVVLTLLGAGVLTFMSLMSLFARIEAEAEAKEDNWLVEQEESIEVWDFKD
jgi:hypothetical protein